MSHSRRRLDGSINATPRCRTRKEPPVATRIMSSPASETMRPGRRGSTGSRRRPPRLRARSTMLRPVRVSTRIVGEAGSGTRVPSQLAFDGPEVIDARLDLDDQHVPVRGSNASRSIHPWLRPWTTSTSRRTSHAARGAADPCIPNSGRGPSRAAAGRHEGLAATRSSSMPSRSAILLTTSSDGLARPLSMVAM